MTRKEQRDVTERLEYRVYYAIAFPIFLMGTLISRIVPRKQRISTSRQSMHRSIFGETIQSINSVMPFVFMPR